MSQLGVESGQCGSSEHKKESKCQYDYKRGASPKWNASSEAITVGVMLFPIVALDGPSQRNQIAEAQRRVSRPTSCVQVSQQQSLQPIRSIWLTRALNNNAVAFAAYPERFAIGAICRRIYSVLHVDCFEAALSRLDGRENQQRLVGRYKQRAVWHCGRRVIKVVGAGAHAMLVSSEPNVRNGVICRQAAFELNVRTSRPNAPCSAATLSDPTITRLPNSITAHVIHLSAGDNRLAAAIKL